MYIRSIEAINFLSYEKFFYEFKSKSILIQGINKTDDNQESNGTGKTGFQAAIEYSLYGNTSQKIRDKDLIRFGQNEAYLKLIIECDVRRETLIIVRRIRRIGSGQLELSINGEKVKVATVIDGNNLINEWIGISKEDLQNYYIINNKRYRSFFYASNTDKIQIISRFSNAHLINGVIPKINAEVVALEEEIQEINLEKARLEGVVETFNAEMLNRGSEHFSNNKEQILKNIKQRIEEKEKQKKDTRKIITDEKQNLLNYDFQILNIKKSCKEASEELKKIDLSPYEKQRQESNVKKIDLKISRDDQRKKMSSQEKDLQELEKTLAKINKNLLASVKCPQCQFEFFPGDELANVQLERQKKAKIENVISNVKTKIEVIELKLSEIYAHLEKVYDDQSKNDALYDELNKKVIEVRSTLTSFNCQLTEIESFKKISVMNINDAENVISIMDDQIREANREYEQTQKSEYDKKSEVNYKNKIKFHKKLINECEKGLDDLIQKLTDTTQWIHNFKAFKAYLANQFLRVIEGLCNQFLSDLRSDIQVKWEGFKIKADGSMSERITPYVVRQGETRDFSSFSGGERARMEFALILTIRELINRAHPYGGLQFMFADEIFEGLDGFGLSSMMKTISDFNYPILVTTHVTDSNLYSDIVTIVKEKGISRIYE